jgi:thiol-disulfide isomerase/thioredoxin
VRRTGFAPWLALLALGCAGPEREAQTGQPAQAPTSRPAAGAAGGPEYATRGPQVLDDPAAAGVGLAVDPAPWADVIDGAEGTLADLVLDAPAVVVVFTSLRCPVTREYAPGLAEWARPWQERGVRFLAVNPNRQDDDDEIRETAQRLGWTWPVTRDPTRALSQALGAERTADVFLLDGEGVLRYRGALDDRVGINYRLPSPRRALLADALEAVLAGRAPEVSATAAPGCLLARAPAGEGEQ